MQTGQMALDWSNTMAVPTIAPERRKKAAHRSQETAPNDGDPTRTERTLAVGSNRCLCRGCGRHFGGPSTFDRHQTLTDAGDAVCHDPAARGLVVTWKGGHAWWSSPARFGRGDDDA